MRDYFYDTMNKIFDLYLNKNMYFYSIRQQVSGMYYVLCFLKVSNNGTVGGAW